LLMSEEKLKRCFVEAFNISEDTDFESLNYRGIEQWDSLGHMQLVVAIETNFEIMLETDDVIDMSSFNKAKDILGKYGIEFNA
jgi:acyl carrier protein